VLSSYSLSLTAPLRLPLRHSINILFALYFGVLLVLIGSIILARAFGKIGTTTVARRPLLICFALFVIAAGCLCIFFKRSWFTDLSVAAKIPLYSTLGISVCFAVSFSFVDLINFIIGSYFPDRVHLVESPAQVYLVFAVSAVMGCAFGVVFGLLDVGAGVTNLASLKSEMYVDERYCYPLGAALGAVGAVANEWLRASQTPPGQHLNRYMQADDNL
jgi:hypothetical protein